MIAPSKPPSASYHGHRAQGVPPCARAMTDDAMRAALWEAAKALD
jgi:hypothetical protein